MFSVATSRQDRPHCKFYRLRVFSENIVFPILLRQRSRTRGSSPAPDLDITLFMEQTPVVSKYPGAIPILDRYILGRVPRLGEILLLSSSNGIPIRLTILSMVSPFSTGARTIESQNESWLIAKRHGFPYRLTSTIFIPQLQVERYLSYPHFEEGTLLLPTYRSRRPLLSLSWGSSVHPVDCAM